jgi:Asp-tRNA(Asn)/Glu-tRNA(Gln) amidotransferase A subunit family amidase
LDVTRGPAAGDIWWAPPAERPYAEEVNREPKKLRIALVTKDLSGEPIHADCKAGVEQAAKLCAELGHYVEEVLCPSTATPHATPFACCGSDASAAWFAPPPKR